MAKNRKKVEVNKEMQIFQYDELARKASDPIRKMIETARLKNVIEDGLSGNSSDSKRYLPTNKGTLERIQAFFVAYVATKWNISEACRQIGFSRSMYEHWKTKFIGFNELFDVIKESKKDWIESKLVDFIDAGSEACLIFTAKTQLKDRGYTEYDSKRAGLGVGLGLSVEIKIVTGDGMPTITVDSDN